MGYAILRAAKRDVRGTAAMLAHALRERPVPNAVRPPKGSPPLHAVVAGSSSSRDAQAHLRALKASAVALGQRWRADAVMSLDILVTVSPGDAARLTRPEMLSYLSDSLTFIKSHYSTAQVLTAVIHDDETTPHLQILLAPTDTRGYFAGSAMLGGPKDLTQLQDKFHDSVGVKYGLMRGERRSKATHIPVRKFYAALAKDPNLPAYVEVPPAPTWSDKLTGASDTIAKRRANAIAHNAAARKKIEALAGIAVKMHPSQIERASKRYRDAVQSEAKAHEQLRKSSDALDIARSLAAGAAHDRVYIEDRIKTLHTIDDKSRAQLIDKISALIDPHYVTQLSKQLGIKLTPGKPLCDQIRKGGAAVNLIDAANLLDKYTRGEIITSAKLAVENNYYNQAPKP